MNTSIAARDFLFCTWEGGGNVPPVLSAARKLVGRGHHVRVMAERCNREEIEAVGAEFVGYTLALNRADKTAANDIVRDWEGATPAEQLGRVQARVMCGPALAYARDVYAEIQRRRPGLLVGSDLLYGPMVGAEAAQTPYAILSPNISLHPLPGVPPFGPGFLPASNEQERLRDEQAATANRAWMNLGLPAVNAARQAFGLPPLADLEEQVAKAKRYWLATSAAFDFPAERLPDNLRYVGPELEDAPTVAGWVSPWPKDDPRPLVLASLSTTFQNQGETFQRLLDALGSLPVRGLATHGPALEASQFRVPDNVALVKSAPHAVVMQEAAVAITHCGHGTVMKALAAKLPLLCLPMGRDQHDNAARVVFRGAGLRLSAQDSAEAFAQALRRLLEEPSFREAAGRLGTRIAADAARSSLLAELETLAAV